MQTVQSEAPARFIRQMPLGVDSSGRRLAAVVLVSGRLCRSTLVSGGTAYPRRVAPAVNQRSDESRVSDLTLSGAAAGEN